MTLFQIIGYAAAVCTTLSFLPQAIKTIQTKSTESLSLSMYSMFTIGILLWLVYGIHIQDLPLIIANAVTLFLAGTILIMKIKHG